MKASGKFLSAASAVALSAGLVVPAAVAVQFAFVSFAQAAVVSRIDVQGNQRVDAETIRGYLDITPGKSFSNADIDEAVKRLFATGLFSDVRINQSGSTLVVQVDEYSVVNQVLFQGNKKLKDAELAAAVQLKPRGSFSQDMLNADVEAIKAAYSRIGRDDTEVTTQIMDLGENRVNVVFEINEGGRTKIAAVNFNGNNAYSDRRLRDLISTKRSSILSYFLRNDIYAEDKLRADEEALRRFYYNHGYADFRVISSSADLDPSTNEYIINFTVEEGERYTFGDVTIESNIEGVTAESLGGLIETSAGNVYSAKDVEDTIIALTEKVAGMGYAFAQVTPRGDRNFENRTISVVYAIDQGPRTYVERIEIRGNERTRDYVIRREFDISEGDAFNQVLVQRAKRRLEALDFFTSVEISTAPGSRARPGHSGHRPGREVDRRILDRRRLYDRRRDGRTCRSKAPSPNATSSAAASSSASRRAAARTRATSCCPSPSPISSGGASRPGFDIYRQTRTYDNYESNVTGGTIRFGLPITQTLSTQIAYNLSKEEYEYDDDCLTARRARSDQVQRLARDPGRRGQQPVDQVVGQRLAALQHDRRHQQSALRLLRAGLPSKARAWAATRNSSRRRARARYYHTLSEEWIIVGLLTGRRRPCRWLRCDDGLRTFDLFKSSDRIIRGFEFNGIGPYDAVTGEQLGGESYLHASAEAQFPLPVVPESFGLRGAVFADAGNGVRQRYCSGEHSGPDRGRHGHGMACLGRCGPDLGVAVRTVARRLRLPGPEGRERRGTEFQFRHFDPLLVRSAKL